MITTSYYYYYYYYYFNVEAFLACLNLAVSLSKTQRIFVLVYFSVGGHFPGQPITFLLVMQELVFYRFTHLSFSEFHMFRVASRL